MIYIAGISIALFISALLLNKKNKSRSDIFLLLWMLLIAAHLYLYYLFLTGGDYKYPHLLAIGAPFPLLHGVFLYYYVSSITNQFPKKNWLALLHLIPAIAAYIYLVPFFQLSAEQKIELFENNLAGHEVFMEVGKYSTFLSGVIYVVWSGILLQKHKKNIQNQFSDIENISLKWLQFITYGMGVIWCFVIFLNNNYLFSVVSVYVILIGFFGVQQKTIFTNGSSGIKKSFDSEPEKEKYATSLLPDDMVEDVYKRLIQLLSEKELYKKNELSLDDLASELDIHPNYLSQIINTKEEKNFYDFINAFRVEEFKRLVRIPENKQFTLLALAYDCGFNSRSSFNRIFKKHTAKTPSGYVEALVD